MIDHMSVYVFDIARSVAFYDAALKPLGFGRAMEFTAPDGSYRGVAYGPKDKPVFWLGAHLKERKTVTPTPGFHVAFQADARADVDAFYAAAIQAGGRDNGAPGLRPHYHPNYYGAFVIDPEKAPVRETRGLAEPRRATKAGMGI